MIWFSRAVAVVAVVLFIVGAFSVLPPTSSQGGAYLADRNLGLAGLLLVLLVLRWERSLGAVLLATAAMHAVDAIADLHFGNAPAAAGSIVVAVLSAVAGYWLVSRQRPPDRAAG